MIIQLDKIDFISNSRSPEKVGRIWRIILNSRIFHRAFSFSFFTRIQKRIYFRLKSFTMNSPETNSVQSYW